MNTISGDPVEGVDYDDEGGFRFGLIPAGRNNEYY